MRSRSISLRVGAPLAVAGVVLLFASGRPLLLTPAGAAPPDAGPAGASGASSPEHEAAAPERLAPPPRIIDESSGLAASRRVPGRLWTCNDSGGGETLVRYDPHGLSAAEAFRLRGIRNRDWEDLAAFEWEERAFLLIADTGDNLRSGGRTALHFLEEPPADADPEEGLEVLLTLRFAFADGARDCEAVAVDVTRGVILLGSKEIDQNGKTYGASGLYEIPLPPMPAAPVAPRWVDPVPRVGTMPTLMPTGMDVSPDGRRLGVCTYGEAMVFTSWPGAGWASALEAEPERPPTPPRRQGEAIAFSADGRSLYFTSEGVDQPTWRLTAP
ncbi:PD40 domain-containing protein [Phycisphaera mikurensis]|uniref:Uncharacterized protein n=1 Tax=Phycisphaera mikurensis (strain NBRC 102666 / KCTC 22515 / FYK2301M01) TaxID=1142394 RepID=I0IIS9_PHYMF|nr:PD40 domain-containing protein [Phycisphaera mikurensis]MBB6442686.1 hypothetical protein [Phycisphaera mikurensis]BAM05167.1 hypothetical protein PSMK_30080 [Phycisphaera mikurensis NBRC 102666]